MWHISEIQNVRNRVVRIRDFMAFVRDDPYFVLCRITCYAVAGGWWLSPPPPIIAFQERSPLFSIFATPRRGFESRNYIPKGEHFANRFWWCLYFPGIFTRVGLFLAGRIVSSGWPEPTREIWKPPGNHTTVGVELFRPKNNWPVELHSSVELHRRLMLAVIISQAKIYFSTTS